MRLIWNGHACFTLETDLGSVVFDPYQDHYVPGLTPIRPAADLVLCTHEHRDHGAREVVTLTGNTPAFSVESLDTYHDPEQGALRGTNTVYIVSAEGMRLAHVGDLGCMPAPEQVERLRGVDVLLVPVGGFYTIDAAQAMELVQAVNPRIVVPMHYRSDTFGYEVLATVEDYLALCHNAVSYDANVLEITADTPAQTAVLRCPN